jgi:putative DNA primase/helicase
MGALTNSFPPGADHIDFAAVKAASLRSVESLVRGWLPAGRRQGDEWVAINPTRSDKKAGSFSINTKTGVWSDFATDETGGDMIDLLVYLGGKSKLEAARELGDMLNVPLSKGSTSLTGNIRSMPPASLQLSRRPRPNLVQLR